jgi:hypothetical protein
VASLVSLQAQGGGRIPMDGFTYDVSRQDLVAILDAMPTMACRALHLAVRQGDLVSARRLLREAAQSYFAAAPAAPTVCSQPVPRPCNRRHHTRHS